MTFVGWLIVGFGVVLVWSGVKNYSVLCLLQNTISNSGRGSCKNTGTGQAQSKSPFGAKATVPGGPPLDIGSLAISPGTQLGAPQQIGGAIHTIGGFLG